MYTVQMYSSHHTLCTLYRCTVATTLYVHCTDVQRPPHYTLYRCTEASTLYVQCTLYRGLHTVHSTDVQWPQQLLHNVLHTLHRASHIWSASQQADRGVVLTGLLEVLFLIFILNYYMHELATVSDTSVRRQASTEVLIQIES